MKKKIFKNTEWSILICVFLLVVIGLIALYSATLSSELYEFKKQCMWILISIPVMIMVMFIDYEIISRFSSYLYGLALILLIGVLFTEPINGASSWFDIGFFAFQPAEFGKIFIIIFLSTVIVNIQKKGRNEINKFSKLLIAVGTVLLPTILIALQPDFGTAIAYITALVFILYVSGIDKKYIIISILALIVAIPLLYLFVLPEHAKLRIDVYLNPELDPRGAGYNIIQSKIAIGAGKLFGMGMLQGNQTHLGFLYPKTTDFIFSMIGEEFGFITCGLIVLIYVILITKAINIAKNARDDLGSYIAIGIARNIFISHIRKYRYDNRSIANNRSTTTICKLWGNSIFNKSYFDRAVIKYKQ